MFAGHRTVVLAASLLLVLSAGGVTAQVIREPEDPLDALTIVDPRLQPTPAGATFDSAAPGLEPEVRADWVDFLAGVGGPWKSDVDLRTGRIDFAEGAGVPWIPGAAAGKPSDLGNLEARARAFLPRIARMMGIEPADLVLAGGRSGHPADHLWLVDFDVQRDGLRVEGARVVFRVNNGNLIQFGTENLPSPGTEVPSEKIGRKEALGILADYVGGFSAADAFVDGGSAKLLPLAARQDYEPGEGRGLVRAWEFVFRRRGSHGTWRARIDATTGDLLELLDVNRYAKATGGIYPVSYIFNDETVRPMPYADLSSGGFTNSGGQFTYGGGTVTSTLSGQFVDVNDMCGLISQSSGSFGNIAFGSSAGTDCTTPGSGGAGNTHAARTQFYHVNRIKEVGRGWLPASSWLSAQLPVNVNISDVCNAYYDGFSINFFRSGAGCGNTGEIAGVSLHEYGHGLDDHDGISIGDLGTAESYADVTAALMLHDSCMGPGFFGGNCTGYGDACTSCTGVRDLDWAKRVSNVPHTVDNFTRQRCFSTFYAGPCGREGHCESYVASEAIWDLAARDLPSPGSAAAWMTAERLWYLSRPTATVAFTCNTSNVPWTSDGCTTGSWWRTMRAVDDDDGNLANGTPHSCQLFAAFDRHGLACAADPGANVCFSGCAPPVDPALALTPGDRQVALSWTSSGAGVTYDVFRSEAGCGSGFMKIADSVAGTAYTDLAVANGMTYSYTVVAHATGNGACAAPPTACQSVMPQAPPCNTPPPAPTGLVATVQGVDRISLSWNAVPGALFYELLRAPSSGGPWTPIANVAPPAVTHLDTGLTPATAYFYVVRTIAGETCVSGDSTQASATTIDCQNVTLYANDFETGSGLADWTVGSHDGGDTDDWRGIQACTAHSGSKIFRFGGPTCGGVYQDGTNIFADPMGAAGIEIPAGAAYTRLSFWHRWQFEFGYDGGTLSLSLDGDNYVGIPGSAILNGASYNGSLFGGCHPPGSGGTPTFTGGQSSFVSTEVDLDRACDLASGTTDGCRGRSVRISFSGLTDCSAMYEGWFLDDVTVTACVPHGCTGAPAIGTATTPAPNQVLLTWSNGAPASTSFNVYRAFGTCAAPGTFTKIATGVGGNSYLDSPVSGSTQYAYRVAGLDATGVCESDLSACVNVVPTGPCTLAPAFAGLASAEDPVLTNCSVGLAWSPATSRCSGSTVSYDVFRSTSPDFTPAPGNRIATGVAGTSFLDTGTLQYETPYYYIVRAVDSLSGVADGNTEVRSAAPTGPLTLPVTISESFEAADGFDQDDWSRSTISGAMSWTWSTARSQSPSHSWHGAGFGFSGNGVLVSPPVQIASDTVLSFWHTYEFEDCFDGGTLEISTDGGFKWAPVPASAFLAGGYTGQIHSSYNPLYGRDAWCYGALGALTEVRASLANWAGKTARLRWHAGEDFSVASPGWFVDTVTFANARVTNACTSAPPPALDFYTATPCRILDTRNTHPPALQPHQMRSFQITGVCGVPATAKAISANLTVVNAGALGDLNIFRADLAPPIASAISFKAGATRGNNAIVALSDAGALIVKADTDAPVDFILDVNGYFKE